eukprot:1157386-Pelagomonas_calceolata.AAC.6
MSKNQEPETNLGETRGGEGVCVAVPDVHVYAERSMLYQAGMASPITEFILDTGKDCYMDTGCKGKVRQGCIAISDCKGSGAEALGPVTRSGQNSSTYKIWTGRKR